MSSQVASDTPLIISHFASLERILNELLTNTCKYSPPDSTITVTAKVLENNLELYVTNTGIEIPASELDRIFQPFYRYASPNSWDHSGTGLGLALVKKLVQRLDGKVYARSQSRETVFVIILPL